MNLLIKRNDDFSGNCFLQSRFWAEFKAISGWTWTRYECENDGKTFDLSVMERAIALGFRFAYIPHGPNIDLPTIAQKQELLLKLASELKKHCSKKCLFIRFDPQWYMAEKKDENLNANKNIRPVFDKPLLKASDVQPPDTVILDIKLSENEILSQMKPKWRYNIRLSEKKEVEVVSAGISGIDDFYKMYETTSLRDKIAIHPMEYYSNLFQLAEKHRDSGIDLRLFLAKHEGKSIAAIITVFYKKEAIYLYGASSDEKRNLMPAYALQWKAIREAKNAGCEFYDFYGIPPVDDPNHPMSGLYRFKTGFGGEIRHYSGTYDYVLNHFMYFAYRMAEKLRLFWYKTIKKKF